MRCRHTQRVRATAHYHGIDSCGGCIFKLGTLRRSPIVRRMPKLSIPNRHMLMAHSGPMNWPANFGLHRGPFQGCGTSQAVVSSEPNKGLLIDDTDGDIASSGPIGITVTVVIGTFLRFACIGNGLSQTEPSPY